MLAFIPALFPVATLLLGAGAGIAACTAKRPGGGKKAEIAELKARIAALERKP